jgi:hypothetical protein
LRGRGKTIYYLRFTDVCVVLTHFGRGLRMFGLVCVEICGLLMVFARFRVGLDEGWS